MIEFRDYKEGDQEGIVDLYNESFKPIKNIEYIKWKYSSDDTIHSMIAIAEENNKIIGHVALTPTMIKIHETVLMGGHLTDGMVKEEYQRKGIFQQLANNVLKTGLKRGLSFEYSFPTSTTLQCLETKLEGLMVGEIPVLMKIYRLDRFLQLIIGNRLLSKIIAMPISMTLSIIKRNRVIGDASYKKAKIQKFDESFDILWQQFQHKHSNAVVRSSLYLDWRVMQHPDKPYETIAILKEEALVGYIILKVDERKMRGRHIKVGSIVDLVSIDEKATQQLLLWANDYFKKENVDFATAWALSHLVEYNDVLQKIGFTRSKGKIPFVIRLIEDDPNLKQQLTKLENWYIMPIDTDSY